MIVVAETPGSEPVQINRCGVIPKRHQPGKWRLIVNLSFPKGHSVTDGVEPELCSLSDTSVDRAVQRILTRGAGARLAKFDVEGAYRTVSVHPEDRHLLGMRWRGVLHIDTVLPFGLRSAPKIYNAIADALLWIVSEAGVDAIHYLDDFLIIGSPDPHGGERELEIALGLCQRLGVPIAEHKTEGPATTLTFLGMELDTDLTVRLPSDKLERLQREIRLWKGRRCSTKRELESLIGQLQHACCAVRPGRSFLRQMIELLAVAKEPHHRIRLNKGFRSDLQWWFYFLPKWDGQSMMAGARRGRWDITLTSDASGSWGCGAFNSSGDWFQLEWPQSWEGVNIMIKELLPIVIGAAVWGQCWKGKTVRCLCNNAATVGVLNSGRSKIERAMHLMRSLFFFLAYHNITLWAEHIPGRNNGAADALSRNNYPQFCMQVPQASQYPTTIPATVLQTLVRSQPDWTETSWTELLVTTL